MRRAGNFDETTRSLLLIAAQPLAHRGHGGLEKTSRGFDASLPSRLNQTQAMIVGVSHLAYQDEVASGGHSGLYPGPPPGFCGAVRPAPSRVFSLTHFNLARGIRCE